MAINLTIGYSTYGIINIQLPYMYKKAGDGLVRTGIQEWFAITLYLMQCHFIFFLHWTHFSATQHTTHKLLELCRKDATFCRQGAQTAND